ncbi:MAG: SHOCT domain-containing protein [Chloroflexi bacterium]|nr:SHOCT domain-containing protein [Chloroflexota bacterium]
MFLGGLIFIFVLVGAVIVCSLGTVLAVIVEAINPQVPEGVLGPLLCPVGTSLDIKYVRSLGGSVRETLMNCVDTAGEVVATRSGIFSLLWYGLFVAPLLPLVYPIVVGLRRHNFAVRGRTAPGVAGFTTGEASARLRELEDLRAGGLITENEYQRKRSEILAEL